MEEADGKAFGAVGAGAYSGKTVYERRRGLEDNEIASTGVSVGGHTRVESLDVKVAVLEIGTGPRQEHERLHVEAVLILVGVVDTTRAVAQRDEPRFVRSASVKAAPVCDRGSHGPERAVSRRVIVRISAVLAIAGRRPQERLFERGCVELSKNDAWIDGSSHGHEAAVAQRCGEGERHLEVDCWFRLGDIGFVRHNAAAAALGEGAEPATRDSSTESEAPGRRVRRDVPNAESLERATQHLLLCQVRVVRRPQCGVEALDPDTLENDLCRHESTDMEWLVPIAGPSTSRWLAEEAARIRSRDNEFAAYDARGLFDDSDDEYDDDPFAARRGEWRGLVYYTSEAASGHGDVVWASGEWLAARLLDDDLRGKKVLELGAGAGLPSLAAASRGATVVATDVAAAAVYCLALAAQRHAMSVRRLTWGDTLDDTFDLVLTADCVYDPASHSALLRTAAASLRPQGAVLVAFAFHGNTPDDVVLSFFETARQSPFAFAVDYLGATQLRPSASMRQSLLIHADDHKRARVHAYRLTQP